MRIPSESANGMSLLLLSLLILMLHLPPNDCKIRVLFAVHQTSVLPRWSCDLSQRGRSLASRVGCHLEHAGAVGEASMCSPIMSGRGVPGRGSEGEGHAGWQR